MVFDKTFVKSTILVTHQLRFRCQKIQIKINIMCKAYLKLGFCVRKNRHGRIFHTTESKLPPIVLLNDLLIL